MYTVRDVIRQSIKGRKTPHPFTKDSFMAYWIKCDRFCFQDFQSKRRKSSERRKNHMPAL